MKNEQLIKNLIQQGESDQLEFKEVVRKEEIAKSLCAFLNGDGGTVLIGVQVNGEIREIKDADKKAIELKQYLLGSIIPEAPITVSVESIDEKNIILVKVWNGSKPPYVFDGTIYFRKGFQTEKAKPEDISKLIISRQKNELHWERQLTLGVEITDLDLKLIESVLVESQKNLRGSFKGDDILEFLSHYGLYLNGAFSNACVVLFAKNPTRYIPQVRVRLTEYAEGKTGNRLLRDELFEGNLFDIKDKLERYVNGLGIRSVFSENQWKRIDFKFPVKALQEGIINTLMHRDYSSPSSGVSISVYSDSFVISNSGHLPDGLTERDLKTSHRSHPVNPDIAHVVFLTGLIDKLGRGTLKVIEECNLAGLKIPGWKDTTDGVTLTFNGPKALSIKKENTKNDGVSDGVNDGVNDGVSDFINDGISDGVINSVSDGVKKELLIIVHLINDNPGINTKLIAESTNKPKPTIERYIRIAKETKMIDFQGSSKTGGYYVTEKMKEKLK